MADRVKAFSENLVCVKSKLATSRVESVNSRWNARSDTKSACKVEEIVRDALRVVSEALVGLELKSALKRVSTQITRESEAAVSYFWSDLKRDNGEL